MEPWIYFLIKMDPTIDFSIKNYYTGPIETNLGIWDHQNVFSSVLSSHPLLVSDIPARDVTRVGETIAYSRLRQDLDDFGRSRLLVLVLQQQLA